jgi:hypothetical protein
MEHSRRTPKDCIARLILPVTLLSIVVVAKFHETTLVCTLFHSIAQLSVAIDNVSITGLKKERKRRKKERKKIRKRTRN